MLTQRLFRPIAIALNNTTREMEQNVEEKNEIPSDKLYQREARDSMRQINMLTNDLKDFPDDLGLLVETTIMSRPQSYYGYVLVPAHITDAHVIRTLSYDDPQDKYFMQLTTQMNLDFTWYDACGRHVMVWSGTKQIMKTALWAIERWLE
jgi:hypothetical protein